MNLKQLIFSLLAVSAVFTAAAAPVVDGKLDDAVWAKAQKFDKFFLHNTKTPAPPCTAMLFHDSKGVYVGFHVPFEPNKKLRAKVTKRDGRVFTDDSVEVMIAPTRGRDCYVHFTVNSIGTIADAYADQGGFVADSKWNGNVTAKTFVGKDFWSAELFVPYATLELADGAADKWGFNFCRNLSEPSRYSSILPNGEYHVSGAFVEIKGFDHDFSNYEWRITPPSWSIARKDGKFVCKPELKLANNSRKAGTVNLDVTLSGSDIAAVESNITLAANASTTAKLPVMSVKNPGNYKVTVTLSDPVNRKRFIRRTYPLAVKFNPVEVSLLDPHYRNAIFASENLKQVRYKVAAGDKSVFPLTTGIKDENGKVIFSQTLDKSGVVEFPTDKLAVGKYTIFAGKNSDIVSMPLRKLAPQKNEVWRDKQGFWRANGKRFFMISEWGNVTVPGVNLSNMRSVKESRHLDMAMMSRKHIVHKEIRKNSISLATEKAIRKEIAKNIKDEKLFARYLADEPEIMGTTVSAMAQAAAIIRDVDPYHPLVISNNSVIGMLDYIESSEINGLHCYPNPEKGVSRPGFNRIVAFMDQVKNMNDQLPEHRKQSIFYLQQGFNYGDWGRLNSRIPTFDEVRTQFLMTSIMGGRGIMFWNRSTLHYPELYIGMPEVGREFAALHDVLCEDDQPNALTQGKLRTMIKKHNGKLWIFAVSTQTAPFKYEFNFPELKNQTLAVWREGRKITAQYGKFSDTFNNYDVHIYTNDVAADNLKTVAEVEKLIADANAKRCKPGNQAFQAFEHDFLQFRSSSNFWLQGRNDNTLWHVSDGVDLGKRALTYDNNRTYFKDNTPGKVPDWIEMEFPKAIKAKKVVVCGIANSLKDYEVQILKDGKFVTVGSIKNAKLDRNEFTFPETEFKVLRVFVTKNNGKYTQIAEIEVY